MEKFFEFIKDENPQIIINLYDYIDNIEKLFVLIKDYNIDLNNYKEIKEIYEKLVSIKNILPIEGIQLSVKPLEQNSLDKVYSLNNDFSYSKPKSYSLYREKQIEISSYKELYEKLLKYLYKIDNKKMYSLIEKTKYNGKSRAYFSNKSANMYKPIRIGENLFAETYFSSNGIRDMLIKLFKYYDININNLRIYINYDRKEKFGYYK